MKLLLINNFFYERGGAEKSLFDMARLLEDKGHEVYFFSSIFKENLPYKYDKFFISDVDYYSSSFFEKIKILPKIYWNYEAHRKLQLLFKEIGVVDLVHINNIMYRIGPSILKFLKNRDLPIVFHLRDYNLMCGAINLMANGHICEACKDYKFLNIVKKRCKGGLVGSFILSTSMFFYHNIMKFFDYVNVFISPSFFLKNKYIELGFNRRIEVLPNFLNTEKFNPWYGNGDGSFVYFGRLSQEKGIMTLLNVCKMLPQIRFKIIGTGPIFEECKKFVSQNNLSNVKFFGYLKGKTLYDEIRRSKAAIVPSEWYENNSKAIMESMALGKPVIASRIGGNPELVRDNETGYLFEAFNSVDLAEKIVLLEKEKKCNEMGKRAREIIEKFYNPYVYYDKLMSIYNSVIK